MKKGLVTIFYLFNSIFIVVRSDRYITAIDDLQSRLEGIYLQWNIVATVKGQTTRTSANSSGAEASTRAIRGPGILQTVTGFISGRRFVRTRTYEGCANECDVKGLILILTEASNPGKFGKSGWT